MKTIIPVSLLLFSFSLSAQSIVTDTRTGCQVVTENPSPLLTVNWSGSCEEKWATGQGTLSWFYDGKEVASFTGILKQGLPHGKGRYKWSNGYVQEGNYFQGQYFDLDSSYLARLEKVEVAKTDPGNLYINDGNAQSLFYYILKPSRQIKGVLILLGGSTEPANYVFNNARALTEKADASGLVVIVPSLNNNLWLGAGELNFLNTVFAHALQRYRLPERKIVMGGFSLGGFYALRYAEMSYDPRYKTAIRPVAVFGADPPLDLAWLYNVFQKEVKRSVSESTVAESRRYLLAMETELGDDPLGEKYKAYSVFSRSEKSGGNTKFLEQVPVRIYCDPDVDWQMANRKAGHAEMGAMDQQTMIEWLNQAGNRDAEFSKALGKGHNPDGTRNPHSWSIIDPAGCIEWMLRWMK